MGEAWRVLLLQKRAGRRVPRREALLWRFRSRRREVLGREERCGVSYWPVRLTWRALEGGRELGVGRESSKGGVQTARPDGAPSLDAPRGRDTFVSSLALKFSLCSPPSLALVLVPACTERKYSLVGKDPWAKESRIYSSFAATSGSVLGSEIFKVSGLCVQSLEGPQIVLVPTCGNQAAG